MIKLDLKYFCLILILFVVTNSANSSELLRATIVSDKTISIVDISLFDNDAPLTVTNFVNNIDTNTYKNIFFNRSIENIFIQTGGYSFDPNLNDGSFSYAGNEQFNGGLQPTPNATTVANEFKLSNLRGTLAMAKPSGNIDSSSNQWFINLSDNTFLDTSSEGFTVFGEILDDGMEVIDQIASTPIYDLSADIDYKDAFLKVPLNNVTAETITNDINNKNLIKISLARLFSITDLIDFGESDPLLAVQKSIVIRNNSDTDLSIGSFDSGAISFPFSVIDDGCSSTTLSVTDPATDTDTCTIIVKFAPATSDYFETTANIYIQTYNRTISIRLKTPGPDIELSRENIDFGFQPIFDSTQGFPEQAVVLVNNNGDRDLNITSINFSSDSMEEFEFFDNCTTENNEYLPGKVQPESFCVLVVNFKPKDLFIKSATISISTDDPNESEVTINISGGNNTDNDGIDNAVEDAAPNNGDGNFDGSPDRLQNNVVSFTSANNIYTTLLTDDDTLFTNVKPVQLSTIEALPDVTTLDNEAFAFELSGFTVGSIAEFGLILPAGHSPTNIYTFGPTDANNTPHWYTLEKNTTPGVYVFGDVSYGASDVSRNITSIRILDGGDGDADQVANGTIVFVGGPEINNQGSSTSGSLLWLLFLVPISILVYRR